MVTPDSGARPAQALLRRVPDDAFLDVGCGPVAHNLVNDSPVPRSPAWSRPMNPLLAGRGMPPV